eukprot:scaffold63174_cov76-Phaeocystis_antarctica.AAC.1
MTPTAAAAAPAAAAALCLRRHLRRRLRHSRLRGLRRSRFRRLRLRRSARRTAPKVHVSPATHSELHGALRRAAHSACAWCDAHAIHAMHIPRRSLRYASS